LIANHHGLSYFSVTRTKRKMGKRENETNIKRKWK